MSFLMDIQKFVTKCNGNADQVVRKTVIDIGTSVIEKTPVGDANYWQSPPPKNYVGGRARGNWAYSLGDLKRETFDVIDPSGQISRDRIMSGVPMNAAGLIHCIENSLPYIIPLEEGHSRQAPNGMVSLTVMEFQQIVNANVKEVNK